MVHIAKKSLGFMTVNFKHGEVDFYNKLLGEPGTLDPKIFHWKRGNPLQVIMPICEKSLGVLLGIIGDTEFTVDRDIVDFIEAIRKLRATNIPKLEIENLKDFQKDFIYEALQQYRVFGQIRMLLGDDPRLGKTVQSLSLVNLDTKSLVLILVPKSLIPHWESEAHRWTNFKIVATGKGSTKQKEKSLAEFLNAASNTGGIFITNWETARISPVLRNVNWNWIIGDEAHRLKNRKSKISEAIKKMSTRVPNVLLLSATFTEKGPQDLWSPLNILYPKVFRSYWDFVGMYNNIRNTRFGIELGSPKNEDFLLEQLQPIMVRRKATDVANMPQVVEETIVTEMNLKQRKLFTQLEEELILYLEGETITIQNKVSLLIRMRQVLSSSKRFGEEYSTARIEAIADYIEGLGEKVVVSINFVDGLLELEKELKKRKISVGVIHGSVPLGRRQKVVDNFSNADLKVIIFTPQTGGVGMNFSKANTLIFADLPWSSIQFRQAKDRILAMDKPDTCLIVYFQDDLPVDRHAKKLLASKIDSVTKTDISNAVVESYRNV